jgi:hypothetical protein
METFPRKSFQSGENVGVNDRDPINPEMDS